MIPVLYTTPGCGGCKDVRILLKEDNINFDEEVINPKTVLSNLNLRRAVTKLRAGGHIGKFQDLMILPIIEIEEYAYNYEDLMKDWPTIKKKIKSLEPRPIQQKRTATELRTEVEKHKPKKKHDDPTLNMKEDIANKVQEYMEKFVVDNDYAHSIEELFGGFSDNEKFAFLIGVRISNHSTAIRIERLLETIKHEMNLIDPYKASRCGEEP